MIGVVFPGLPTTKAAQLLCREKLKHPQAVGKDLRCAVGSIVHLVHFSAVAIGDVLLALVLLAGSELVSFWAGR